jgi:hypothetical protein
MDHSMWVTEKEKRKEQALAEHDRLHKLFLTDRLSFERERKQVIDGFINSIEDEEQKKKLRALQDKWDTRMRHAGSPHNRFVLAQFLFWRHVKEKWYPAIRQFHAILNSKPD